MKVKTEVNVSLKLTTTEQAELKRFLKNLMSTDLRIACDRINEERDSYPYLSTYSVYDLLNKVGQSL